MRAGRVLVSAFCGLAALASQPAVAAPMLAQHRAVYDLSLQKASDRSGISGIAGRMVYEFAGSRCAGYTSTFRFVTRISTDNVSRLTDQQTTTFEEPDGKSFTFASKSYVDQALEKEVRGVATIRGGKTAVTLRKPEPESLVLPATRFPTQHLLELIENAHEGENFYETTIFDGSEDADRSMITSVIIGKPSVIAGDEPEVSALGALASDRHWPVHIAYFDSESGEGEELPTYQTSFKLYDNGVTRDLLMDYGEFAMTGKLVELAMLEPADDCVQ